MQTSSSCRLSNASSATIDALTSFINSAATIVTSRLEEKADGLPQKDVNRTYKSDKAI